MNVVMPTATSSMHTDPALATASSKTAERGLKILEYLLDDATMQENCNAIYAVSVGKETSAKDVDAGLVEVRLGEKNGMAF